MAGETFERKKSANPVLTDLIVCTLDDGTVGAARLPPNGDEEIARKRALERARAKWRTQHVKKPSEDELNELRANRRAENKARKDAKTEAVNRAKEARGE